tara:strand:+ start:25 stop:1002 length:978 start_codon:yes stop_codon:yes gene_type:complete
MKNIINLIVKSVENGQRVDQFISSKLKDLSRTRVKNLILDEKVKINKKITMNPSKKINTKDNIELKIPEPNKTTLKPFNFKLSIVYEDEQLLIIDKPSGISMHPGAGDYEKTLVNALINYDKKNLSNIGEELRPGIVHRIDKDTSGLVVIAKNNFVHEKLSAQFREHSIKRIYIALIWGKLRPQSGKIETFIKRSSKNRQLMEASLIKGKKAITNYKTLKVFESEKTPTFSLIECRLETGRTHQIRVHMSYKGNNILGDRKYKKKFKKFQNINNELETTIQNLNRQFLHASTLGFKHPTSGNDIEFTSNLPKDLNKLLKILKKHG